MKHLNNMGLSAMGICLVGLWACGQEENDDDALIETATVTSALTEDGGEPVDEAPASDPISTVDESDPTSDTPPVLERDCSFNGFRDRLVARYDTDGDGSIDHGERDAMVQDFGDRIRPVRRMHIRHLWMRLRWIYDADGSHSLDREERLELRADLEARCEARKAWLLENYDANQDGTLDDGEWATAREDWMQRLRERRAALIDRFDTNDDGVLGPGERLVLRGTLIQELRDRRVAFIDRFDVDGNGVLEGEELLAAKEELKRHVRGEYIGS